MSDTVQVSVDEGVMIVTINRPEAKNAINAEVAQGIAAAMMALDSNQTATLMFQYSFSPFLLLLFFCL